MVLVPTFVVLMVALEESVVMLLVVVPVVVEPLILIHMYVAGSVLQCPSPVQLAVMVTLESSQVRMMDDPSNVVV